MLISYLLAVRVIDLALAWFKSYLINKHRFVSISKHKSATANVAQGVPQGSGPDSLPFIIYLFRLGNTVSICLASFADDIQIHVCIIHHIQCPRQ